MIILIKQRLVNNYIRENDSSICHKRTTFNNYKLREHVSQQRKIKYRSDTIRGEFPSLKNYILRLECL